MQFVNNHTPGERRLLKADKQAESLAVRGYRFFDQVTRCLHHSIIIVMLCRYSLGWQSQSPSYPAVARNIYQRTVWTSASFMTHSTQCAHECCIHRVTISHVMLCFPQQGGCAARILYMPWTLQACALGSRHFPGGVEGSRTPSNHRQLKGLPHQLRLVLGGSLGPPPILATTHVHCQ
eukprot:4141226-Amphidinium_carterae.2